MIRYTLGWILMFEAGFLLVPLITSIAYLELWPMVAILISIALCAGIGFLCSYKKPLSKALYSKDGLVIVALSWIFLSLFGALPFYISGSIPSFIDALFESASGFSTTGASIVPLVEELPKSMLMWRSFTHWVGGMGVLVFIMAFLPLSGAQNLHIMRAESPGPSVSKLVPKMKTTALILYLIYFILTVIMFIILLFGEMTVFEALNTAFATAGTGGFAIKNDSFASFSPYTQIVTTVFMLVFSINFSSYYLAMKHRWRDAFNLEFRVFVVIVLLATVLITLNVFSGEISNEVFAVENSDYSANGGYTFRESLRHSAFAVASLISTTGFGTENFVAWPAFSQTILVLIMFIGACAGSTGGGIKVSRILILIKGVGLELKAAIHPRQVKKITIDKRPVDNEIVRSVNAYMICYITVFVASLLLLSFENYDFITNFTAITATINNVGPGLGLVGPASNYAFFSPFSKLVLIFNMLAGRLELLPMLLLFAPSTWKK